MTLADGTSLNISADSIDNPVQFVWGHGIVLRDKVTLNEVAFPTVLNGELGNGTTCELDDGQVFYGNVKLVPAGKDIVSLRIYTVEDKNMQLLQASSLSDNNIAESNGSFGPFNYNIDVNINWEDPMKSSFIVNISFKSIKLIDVNLNAQNPVIDFGGTFFGSEISGQVGVNFNEKRVYFKAHVHLFFFDEQYDFPIYSWGNSGVERVMSKTLVEGIDNATAKKMFKALNDSAAASVMVRNTGSYVAKFTIGYDIFGQHNEVESEHIMASMNRQLDIPANATNILVKGYALSLFGWTSVFTVPYPNPVNAEFHLFGNAFSPQWGPGLG